MIPHDTAALALAQADPEVTVEGLLGLVFLAAVAVGVLLGLGTAALAVYRYRRRGDPQLRALVVGLVLIAVAPLPFRVFVTGTVPQVLRLSVPPVVQAVGLVAVLWAMYGDPRADTTAWIRVPTPADVVVILAAIAVAATAVLVGGILESNPLLLSAAAPVAALGTFVACQAGRAAYRYRSPAMASLALGILLLAALPTPIAALLVAVDTLPDVLVVLLFVGSLVGGEAAMFATLAIR